MCAHVLVEPTDEALVGVDDWSDFHIREADDEVQDVERSIDGSLIDHEESVGSDVGSSSDAIPLVSDASSVVGDALVTTIVVGPPINHEGHDDGVGAPDDCAPECATVVHETAAPHAVDFYDGLPAQLERSA